MIMAFYVCSSIHQLIPAEQTPWIQEASSVGECLPGGVFDDDVQTEASGPAVPLRCAQLVLIYGKNHWWQLEVWLSC